MQKLTATEIDQLLSYVEDRERVGWYYGNKEQFEKRHQNIKKYLEQLQILYTPKAAQELNDLALKSIFTPKISNNN